MPTVKGVRAAGDQTGSLELSDKKLISRYSLEYLVQADNINQGVVTIRSTLGLPIVGVSPYAFGGESDAQAICKKKTPKRDTKQPLIWYVVCEFNNDATDSEDTEDDPPENPLARPYKISWSSEYQDVVMEQDFSDPPKKILNPVGHKFDPPPTRRKIIPVVTIQRYQSTFTAAAKLAYEDHVNDGSFYGASAGQALMRTIDSDLVNEEGGLYWLVSYRIAFSIDGWDLNLLNQGSHYSVAAYGAGATLKPFVEGNVPYIGNLNANGTKAPEGTQTFSEFRGYPRANFAALGLE